MTDAPSVPARLADLPVAPVLPRLVQALDEGGVAVLQAPPGAGKTTAVPLALLQAADAGQSEAAQGGRILMLEPRRLATRAAARRMAALLGEPVGRRVGYRMRGETRVSAATRIEVVTEGILTRMIQSDPELAGIGTVIFDEFHERALVADLGLALALEARAALRPDLRLLVMSATLDAAPVARLLGEAPVITAEGRAYPVETRWLDRPWQTPPGRGRAERLEQAAARLVRQALAETEGGILVFLPGEGEIRRLGGLLEPELPPDMRLHMLFSALPADAQQAAIRPAPPGTRKLVLATNIAETSLTIDGIRVVVDSGRTRRARFDPRTGMTGLVTERVTRAEADQRRGRAGRIAPGICYRLWTRGEEGALAPHPQPEIARADLAPLVLEAALWGVSDPARLPFLTPPPEPAVAAARQLLQELGALDGQGRITPRGREMATLPLHPRLAHMVLDGGAEAPLMAALLSARDPLAVAGNPPPPADLTLRLLALRDPGRFRRDHALPVNTARLAEIRREAARIPARPGPARSAAELAALAYPDRIALRRAGERPRYLLSSGRGAALAADDHLAGQRLLVATALDGTGPEARIRQAVPIAESALRALFADRIATSRVAEWSRREGRVRPVIRESLGALVLSERAWTDCPPETRAAALARGLAEQGPAALPLNEAARRLQARIAWARARGADLPDLSDEALIAALDDWLTPALGTCSTLNDVAALDHHALLLARLSWEQRQTLDRLAPERLTAPTGTRLLIDYGGEIPRIAVRLQEMFGQTTHPVIGPDRQPLLIELLSPAGRPVQATTDLPGFWRGSYAEVRKQMRGRYPKHPWPEDPTTAPPTRRTKPRRR